MKKLMNTTAIAVLYTLVAGSTVAFADTTITWHAELPDKADGKIIEGGWGSIETLDRRGSQSRYNSEPTIKPKENGKEAVTSTDASYPPLPVSEIYIDFVVYGKHSEKAKHWEHRISCKPTHVGKDTEYTIDVKDPDVKKWSCKEK